MANTLIIVTGSRRITNPSTFERVLHRALERYRLTPVYLYGVVHGGARGVDTLVARWAEAHDVPVAEVLPDYERHGPQAPLVRNREMILLGQQALQADRVRRVLVVALPCQTSRGTWHTWGLAKKIAGRDKRWLGYLSLEEVSDG